MHLHNLRYAQCTGHALLLWPHLLQVEDPCGQETLLLHIQLDVGGRAPQGSLFSPVGCGMGLQIPPGVVHTLQVRVYTTHPACWASLAGLTWLPQQQCQHTV
jgi:hypothetical protein